MVVFNESVNACVSVQPQPFTPELVAAACEAPKSSKSFRNTLKLIKRKNWQTDIILVFDPKSHCDDEKLKEGQKIVTDGLSSVKAANQQQSFTSAASTLGRILHTLQVFSAFVALSDYMYF